MDNYQKSGYLNSDYKIFYLTDSHSKEFPFHYHDFHKLLIFLEGDISYSVEGREYNLQPGNIILINGGEIHRPVIRNQIPYKRIIAYISPDFFSSFEKEGFHLFHCFLILRSSFHLLNIKIFNISCIFFYKFSSRFYFITH